MLSILLLLTCFAFLAGFIDAVVGGGGLIQLPAMLILLPGLPTANILGTNKLASICGTGTAVWRYSRSITIPWRSALPAITSAFVFSFLGARAVSVLSKEALQPIILVLLIAVAIYTFLKKEFGQIHAPKLSDRQGILFGILTGSILGFYDGFFGPGTGSFLILIFIAIFGFDFLTASAHSKVVNLATNLSALIFFAVTDNVTYTLALPMAAANMAGALVGSKLAINKGSAFVRILFLIVVSGLIAKLGLGLLRSPWVQT